MEFLQKKGLKQKVFIPPLGEESDGSDLLGSPNSTLASSPAGSEGDKRGQFFQNFKDRARRSFSIESLPASITPREPSWGSLHSRKLSKSRHSTSGLGLLSRRNSGVSESNLSSLSRAPTAQSWSSVSSVDWRSQTVEGMAPLEPDPQLLRNKTPWIVVTRDYILKLKGSSDVESLFPTEEPKSGGSGTAPEPQPLIIIPIGSIVSVFDSESTRPSFGTEIWWRNEGTLGFRHAVFYFEYPIERTKMMNNIIHAIQMNNKETSDYTRYPEEISRPITNLFAAEEPHYRHQELNIFPVVPRGVTRREGLTKQGEKQPKSLEGRSYYLAVGAHLCCYIEISKGQGKRGEVVQKHMSFGLVTLECLKGDWYPHEERFIMTFRSPFQEAKTLELASRYYRSIMRVFRKADSYLKPAWPQTWQSREIFRVSGIPEPQYVIDREDYGGLKRTLDAYIAAYRCPPVEWEINWRTKFAPEFRLLPAKNNQPYGPMQLLAVMRALRYNDYFTAVSFRDVDLSVLWDCYDRYQGRGCVGYLSRSCVALGPEDIDALIQESVLYNEFHALAFCSETVRQMDFTNSFKQFPASIGRLIPEASRTNQFLFPIFNLIETGATKCNRLILSGNVLSPPDIANLIYLSKAGLLQALDVSRCGLCDLNLRDLLQALSCIPHSLQALNVSGNHGRVPARIVPDLMYLFVGLRELNLSGSLIGTVPESLIPCDALERLSHLRELDLSQYKINDATILDFEQYLAGRLSQSTDKTSSGLQRLVLNNCGITGMQASQLFNAIGENRGMHLSLNGNPLEEGIEYLAFTIRQNRGPRELHMDMIEFKQETNYALLINALTSTKYMTLLTLVGTAPTPSAGGRLSADTCQALENFFARNKSIRYLNYSGYYGKLDEGQMSKGFGHALQGLARNNTLTHLWIRNQNLHDDIGILGVVLRNNRSLQLLDCQDNGFNMTTLQFLVESIKENCTLTECPFTVEERQKIWGGIRTNLRGPQITSSNKGSINLATQAHESVLKDHFEALFSEMEQYLDRNRQARQENDTPNVSIPLSEDGSEDTTFHAASQSDGSGSDEDRSISRSDTTPKPRRPTVRSSGIAINTSVAAPYLVRPEEGMESPTETIGPVSGMSVSPPEATTPTTPDDASFDRMLKEFGEVGFESETAGGGVDGQGGE